MIKLAKSSSAGSAKVTFSLSSDDVDQPVSVVGDFNEWDPYAHPMKKRSNGTRSVSVELATGRSYRFKYLTDDGSWLTDADAEAVDNDQGAVDSLLHL